MRILFVWMECDLFLNGGDALGFFLLESFCLLGILSFEDVLSVTVFAIFLHLF